MPLSLEPGERNKIWLKSDADKPIESRPVFYAKFLSMRGQRKLGEALDDFWAHMKKDATPATIEMRLVELLADSITGWENMGGLEFSRAAFVELLSVMEAMELVQCVLSGGRLSLDEKKSSELPATSDGANSVSHAVESA